MNCISLRLSSVAEIDMHRPGCRCYHRITPQRHRTTPRHDQKTRESKKAAAIPFPGIRPLNCSFSSLAYFRRSLRSDQIAICRCAPPRDRQRQFRCRRARAIYAPSSRLLGGDERVNLGLELLNRFTKRQVRPIGVQELVTRWTFTLDAPLLVLHGVVGWMPGTSALMRYTTRNAILNM